MSKMSFLQKIGILIEVITSSYWLLLGMGLLLGLGAILITNNRKKKKRNKLIYIIYSLVLCSFLLIAYHQSLNKAFEFLIENLFVVFLFPNYALYFLEIVITNIILWVSLFHYKTSEKIKRVNVVVYLIMNYLLMLNLSVIDVEKLDIFNVSSLYSNEKATVIMELSSSLFITWIIFLTLYKIILIYIRKDFVRPTKKVQTQKEVKKLPTNYKETKIPNYVYGSLKKQKEDKEVKKLPNNYKEATIPTFVFGSVKKPKQEITPEMILRDNLTSEDYKAILQLLKEKKKVKEQTVEKEQLNKVNQQIMDIEKQRIQEMKLREQMREQERYTELDRLFRSMK